MNKFQFALSLSLLLAEIKGAVFWLPLEKNQKPITHNPFHLLCSMMRRWQYNKSACSWEHHAAQLGRCALRPQHHTSPGGAAGCVLESDAPLNFLLFVTDSFRHHCLINCSWFSAIFPLFLPPFITCTQINLFTLTERVEYMASFPCRDQYLHEISRPTKGGWCNRAGSYHDCVSHVRCF